MRVWWLAIKKNARLYAGVGVLQAWIKMAAPCVISELTPELEDAFKQATVIALDVEGVDLGRHGQCSLIQIGVSTSRCFVLDVLGKGRDHPLVCWLRGLLQSDTVEKVIHDCRMDSDALFHLLGICLECVHDTSCWHYKLTGQIHASLNTVLEHNGLKINTVRDSNIYRNNHAFWAARPLTDKMVKWAAGDVCSLLMVYVKQLEQANCQQTQDAIEMSKKYLEFSRNAKTGMTTVRNPGGFIGTGGCKIRERERKYNALMYSRGERSKRQWVVYYYDEASLRAVQAEASS